MISSDSKIVHDRQLLSRRVAELPTPVVFTNGCFDILHRGHVDYLEQAAGFGRSLVIGVNSDDSVRRLEKGTDRPINPLEDRMAVVAALGCVSLVVPFDEDTPLELIKLVHPDHLVKGGDWPREKIVGAEFVTQYDGIVHSIPFKYERSTTDLLNRIREHG